MMKLHEADIPMLTDEEMNAITLLKEKLKTAFFLKKLILFGSKARGDFDKDSDVDLLVLVGEEKNKETRSKLSDVQYDVITTIFDAPLMSILENYDDWCDKNKWIAIRDNVEREGIEIEL
jgi:predicted nucleotidyltransferase